MNKLEERVKKIDIIIGVNLRRLRIDHGLSQEELGSILDVSFQQIQKYERAQNRVSTSSLAVIADYLKVPITAFLDDEDLPEHEENMIMRLDISRNLRKLPLGILKPIADLVRGLAKEQ